MGGHFLGNMTPRPHIARPYRTDERLLSKSKN